jgi:hypothetical protein
VRSPYHRTTKTTQPSLSVVRAAMSVSPLTVVPPSIPRHHSVTGPTLPSPLTSPMAKVPSTLLPGVAMTSRSVMKTLTSKTSRTQPTVPLTLMPLRFWSPRTIRSTSSMAPRMMAVSTVYCLMKPVTSGSSSVIPT